MSQLTPLERVRRKITARAQAGPAWHPRDFPRGHFQEPEDRGAGAPSIAVDQADRRLEDPLAIASEIRRLIRIDHDKLDTLPSVDELWREMDADTLVDGARQRLLSAVLAADLRHEGKKENDAVSFAERVWQPEEDLFQDAALIVVDSHCRGLTVSEKLWDTIPEGEHIGRSHIVRLRRLEDTSYRMEEDQFRQASALEIKVSLPQRERTPAQKRMRLTTGFSVAHTYRVIEPHDNAWRDYEILTSPKNHPRVRGAGAYIKAWPHYYFGLHLLQWIRTLTERHGTPAIVAMRTSDAAGLAGMYPVTKDEVFRVLGDIQTHWRALLPDGYDIKHLETGATGLAEMLKGIVDHNRAMIELSIVQEQVGSGAVASVGTKGANVTVLTTFLRLVRSLQTRLAGLIDRLTAEMIEFNVFHEKEIDEETGLVISRTVVTDIETPRAVFEIIDPEAEERALAKLERGVTLGVILREEPFLRARFGAPPLGDTELDAAIETRDRLAVASLVPGMGGGGSTFNALDLQTVLDQIAVGDMGKTAARLALRRLFPEASSDDIDATLSEAQERAAPPPPPGPVLLPETIDDPAETIEGPAETGQAEPPVEEIADTALTGIQITSMLEILDRVKLQTLDAGAAIEAMLEAFPTMAPERAQRMIDNQQRLAESSPSVEDPSDGMAASEDPRVRQVQGKLAIAFTKLGDKIVELGDGYDATEPPPVRDRIAKAYRGAGLLTDDQAREYAEQATEDIRCWLATSLPDCETDDDRRAVLAQIRRRYTREETVDAAVEAVATHHS